MRKFLSLALVFILLIGLCACDLDTILETQPSTTIQSTAAPTEKPTVAPTVAPTTAPTAAPTEKPTVAPTQAPTAAPTTAPTVAPTTAPTVAPTAAPTEKPTKAPTQKPTDPPHTHSWKAATCEEPKTCTGCGETEGSANGHKFSKGTCSVCGAADPDYSEITYILNVKSKKFHRPSCHRLPTDNRKDVDWSKEEVIEQGYEPCKLCNP